MPHYKDGTEAHVGDQVFGKLYNTEGIRAGTIVSITPGVELCNCMVQFAVAVSSGYAGQIPRMTIWENNGAEQPQSARVRTVKGEAHGSSGSPCDIYDCVDYCAINELTKVGP